jgi:hypothetical protein
MNIKFIDEFEYSNGVKTKIFELMEHRVHPKSYEG